MDTQKVIDKLNVILRHEWTGVAQYAQAGFLISGLWREVYSEMFFGSAEESFGHAKIIGEKISALGGIPTVERNSIQQSQDINEMLENALEFEATAVKHYTEAIELVGDSDRALVILLEDVLKEEQEGVDEISKILRDKISATGSGSSSASKAG
ncbi:MAG: ferritin-like domain-containing protein [bacterium]|nr:ferritin-like domain-containing protein [bacterium]